MKQDFTVSIYVKGEGHNTSRGWVSGEDGHIKDIECDMQPYSRELLLKNYGYDIEVNKRFFINDFEPSIKIGTLLKCVNKQGITETYEVKSIPWDDGYMEVFALGIQE